MPGYQHFGIVGAGAWGTALAAALRRAGRDVTLWAHEAEDAEGINRRHENSRYLPGIALDPAIKAAHDPEALAAADALLLATPAQRLREVARLFAAICRNAPVLIAAKGIELGTLKLMSDIVEEEMPKRGIAVLSGPSFAAEVARGLPTALTLAARNENVGEKLAEALASPALRPYFTNDVVGAQLGGAVKNVLAIACGIVAGRKLGDNARAALITRGLAEMMRLGAASGARAETLMGLSGLGDLVLTCSSPQSRNMSLGIALGEGQALDAILAAQRGVAEGVPTASAAWALAQKRGIDMPIVEAADAVLNGKATIDQTIAALLSRPLKAEGT
jgi:glycerol-3-phosphate dehydrogenase (NAD(P)+)